MARAARAPPRSSARVVAAARAAAAAAARAALPRNAPVLAVGAHGLTKMGGSRNSPGSRPGRAFKNRMRVAAYRMKQGPAPSRARARPSETTPASKTPRAPRGSAPRKMPVLSQLLLSYLRDVGVANATRETLAELDGRAGALQTDVAARDEAVALLQPQVGALEKGGQYNDCYSLLKKQDDIRKEADGYRWEVKRIDDTIRLLASELREQVPVAVLERAARAAEAVVDGLADSDVDEDEDEDADEEDDELDDERDDELDDDELADEAQSV